MTALQDMIDNALAEENYKREKKLHALITYVAGESFLAAAEGEFSCSSDGIADCHFAHNGHTFTIKGSWDGDGLFQHFALSSDNLATCDVISGCYGSGLNDLLLKINEIASGPAPVDPRFVRLEDLRKDAEMLANLLGETPREQLPEHAAKAYRLASCLSLDLQKQKTTKEHLERWASMVDNIVDLASQPLIEHDMRLPKTDLLATIRTIYEQSKLLWVDIAETTI